MAGDAEDPKIYSNVSSPYAQFGYSSQSGAVSDVLVGDSITDYYYDAIGKHTQKKIRQANGYESRWYYTYNASSQISKIEEHISQATTSYHRYDYTYDNLQRLTLSRHRPGTSDSTPVDQINSFSYDQFGNMLSNTLQFPNNPSLDTQTTFDVYAYDNTLNGYTNAQGTVLATYDLSGNLVTEGSRTYTYDGAGRLAAFNGN